MANMTTLTMNDGRSIPQLGYGVFQIDPQETETAVTAALGAGYRSIDTAQAYRNEAGVGAAIAKSGIARDELFITTKLWNANQPADRAPAAIDESLDKLGLDFIDLMLIHWPQPMYDEYISAYSALARAQSDGRIRSIGVSNFTEEHLDRLLEECDVVPVINQIELHPGFNQEAMRKYNRDHDILTEAWSPIGQGKDLLQDPDLKSIAEQKGKSTAQVVLRWHIQLGNVMIPKSVTPSRIEENIDVFDFELSDDEMNQISAMSGGRMGPDPQTFDVR